MSVAFEKELLEAKKKLKSISNQSQANEFLRTIQQKSRNRRLRGTDVEELVQLTRDLKLKQLEQKVKIEDEKEQERLTKLSKGSLSGDRNSLSPRTFDLLVRKLNEIRELIDGQSEDSDYDDD